MLAYNKMFKKLSKNILFLLNVGFIFGTEYLVYCVLNDYSLFVDRLTTKLASVNILYVKIFQAFALNNSLIDDTMNNKLLKFTDNAPWNYSDINLKDLSDVAEKYDLHLGHGYEVPINSGMISLVFKVSKKSNLIEKVIIKMKRKNIQEKLNDAIDNLLFSMYILSFIPIVNKYQLAEVVTKNVEIIKHQTNFLEEIDNMNQIRENCKNLKYIKIPTAVREVTEEYPDIILMEYIQGIKINQIKEEDYEGFAKSVVKFGLVTTIVHGVAHGDLHSGNILFIKDNKDKKYPYKIGVIDFGIIYNVNSQYKELMFDIFSNLFERPPRDSAIKLLNSGIIEPPDIMGQIPKSDYNNILDFTEEILNETIHSSKMANQIQLYKFLSKLKAYLSKRELMNLGIRPSDDFVKSQLVLAMAHGVTLILCKGDFITLMDKCLNELFHTQIIL
jgi:predicted unusual protein kinase regulating ubiquinone biosynthesis (AarF/ABC1/UbiB family)